MRRRLTGLAVLATAGALAAGGLAGAEAAPTVDDGGIESASDTHGAGHHQHGGAEGHLPASSRNVQLVGKMRINQDVAGRVSDVGIHGNHAYLGAFYERDCQKGGVYVFDISNPAAPKQINFIRTANNSYVGEGVQVVRIDTPAFTGDVLAMNNEICGTAKTGAVGGMTLVDVTNPKVHKYLAEGVGDMDPESANGPGVAHTIHSVFIWDAGDRAYAVQVDNEEARDADIFDITDPRRPVMIAEYDLDASFPQIVDPTLGAGEGFLHDMVVKQVNGRWLMLLSYWDSGYVVLDVTDPANATYVGDSDFAAVDPLLKARTGDERKPEGNAHQAEFSRDNDFIVGADEDFDSYSLVSQNLTDGVQFHAGQGSDTPKLTGDTLEGQARFVGRACPDDPAVPAASGPGQIAVVERGVCRFTEKVAAVEQAGGYEAVVIFNREGSDACTDTLGMSVAGNLPTFGVISRLEGFRMFGAEGLYDEAACRAGSGLAPIALGAMGDRLRFESFFDGWGYVHLFRNNAGKLKELDQYAIPQAHDPAFATGAGDLSVHEVAMSQADNRLAYLSYYSGGLRVLRINSRNKLQEVGHFIDSGGSNFWGVQLWNHRGQEYVVASDRDYGVYIFRYTGG